jgi:hypothetical protein
MLRHAVGIISVMVGIVAAATEAVVCLVISPHLSEAILKKDIEGIAILAAICTTGFAVAYAVGKYLYRRIGEASLLAELEQFSRPHIALLHILAAAYMLVAILGGMQQGNWIRSSLVISVALFALAAWECTQLILARRTRIVAQTSGRR